ncbi:MULTISPECIES: ATP-binding cassette domain-containing protein [Corynebacterium]|uniref:ATP-binding cassette domain-containing protein n=1 Tax=Corynebacterium TaxID=1716 RepID=UPI00124D8EEE|nr:MULTISPECIES: ATP-binding cassette domain-containing protein [Corynebacterium]
MITFENVTKTYPAREGDNTAPAVSNFSLSIPSDKTTVFVGSSGSGKTTLLRMINRMVTPTSGRVLIDGNSVADHDPVELRRSIGYVMQASGLLPHRTIADNIATVPRLEGASKSEGRELAAPLLTLLGLDTGLLDRYPSELSGGQAQRVGVARALAHDPAILLMDEPFGAVDPLVRRELQDQLLDLQQRLHKTIVLVTHDMQEAIALGDQVVVLRTSAEIAQVGTPTEIVREPADEFVKNFLGMHTNTVHIEQRDGQQIVVDHLGRVQGIVG